jgi:hypothetical protein
VNNLEFGDKKIQKKTEKESVIEFLEKRRFELEQSNEGFDMIET